MFDLTASGITQDQSFVLQSQVISYVREALIYDKGYVVFAVKDMDAFEFEFYHTDGDSVNALYEETRNETVDRVMFNIDCKVFCKLKTDDKALTDVMRYLYNYFVGQLSATALFDRFKIANQVEILRRPDEEQDES